MYGKIKTFKDLETWKQAHKLVLVIYELTKIFPKEEKYSLTDQIRRAVVSISSNIAEGFARDSKKDKIRFYSIALGSLIEVQNQLQIGFDLGYIKEELFKRVEQQITLVQKLIYGLMKSSSSRIR